VGGQSDIVRDGRTGRLVPAGDARALAAALAQILADRDQAEALGAAGRSIALTEYGRAAVLDRLEALYRGMIARKAA
jgi:glycosyltransferase involved in cell wall biosynthesis